jgi:hypothetical protein
MHEARPEWPAASLSSFIHEHLMNRAYRDVFVAFAWIAADEHTVNPGRLLQPGPWWNATRAQEATPTAPARMCPHHPEVRLSRCDVDGPCADEVRTTDHHAGAEQVRAAIAAGPAADDTEDAS